MAWHKRKTKELAFLVILHHSILQQSAARTDTPPPLLTTIIEHQAKALSASFYTTRNLSTQLISKIPSPPIKVSPKKNTVIAWFDPDTGLLHHQQIMPVKKPSKNKRLSFYNKYIILLHKPCIHQEVDHSRSFSTVILPFVKKQDSAPYQPPITIHWEATDTTVLLFPGKDYSLFTTAKASRQRDNENAVMTSSDQEPVALCWKDTNNQLQQIQLSTRYLEPITDDSSDYLLAFLARHAGIHTIVTSYTNRNGEKVYSVIDHQGLKHTYTYEELHQLYNDLHQINTEKALPENFSVNLPAGGGETPESWFTRYPRFPVNLPRLLAILTENQKLREQLIRKLRENVPARQSPGHSKDKCRKKESDRKKIKRRCTAAKNVCVSKSQEILKAIYSRPWPEKDIKAVNQLWEDSSDVFDLEEQIKQEKCRNHITIMAFNQRVNAILENTRHVPSLKSVRTQAVPYLCEQAFNFTYTFFFICLNDYLDECIPTGYLAFKLLKMLPSIVQNQILFLRGGFQESNIIASQSSLLLLITYVSGEVFNNLFTSWGREEFVKFPTDLIQEFELETSIEGNVDLSDRDKIQDSIKLMSGQRILIVLHEMSGPIIDFWTSLMPAFDRNKTWTCKEAELESAIEKQLNQSTRAFALSTQLVTTIKSLPNETPAPPMNTLIDTAGLHLKNIDRLCNMAASANKTEWTQLLKDPVIENRYLKLVERTSTILSSTIEKMDEIELTTVNQEFLDQINTFIEISKKHINTHRETITREKLVDNESSKKNIRQIETAIRNMESYQRAYKKLYDAAREKQDQTISLLIQADDKEREEKIETTKKMQVARRKCVKTVLSMLPKPRKTGRDQISQKTYSERVTPLSLWETLMIKAAHCFINEDIENTESHLQSALAIGQIPEHTHLLFITYCEKISIYSEILRKTTKTIMHHKKHMESFEKSMGKIELETVENTSSETGSPFSIDKSIRTLQNSGITLPSSEERHAYTNHANKTLEELKAKKEQLSILLATIQNTADELHRRIETFRPSISNPTCQSHIDFTTEALKCCCEIECWLYCRDKKIEATLQKNKKLMKLMGIYGRNSGFKTPSNETVVTLKAKQLEAIDISEDTSIESLCLALTLCMPMIPSTHPESSKPDDSQKIQLPEGVKDSLAKMLQQMKTHKDDHLRSEASAW